MSTFVTFSRWITARPVARRSVAGLLGLLLCGQLLGCNSTLMGRKEPQSSEEELLATVDVDEVQGPLERLLGKKKENVMYSTVGQDEMRVAEEHYKAGRLKEARKIAHDLSHKRKYRDLPVREDSLFLLAKIHFQEGDYPEAEDAYGHLLKDFPNTRHTHEATKDLFVIARTWLNSPKVVTTSEVRPVNFDNPKTTELVEPEDHSDLPLSYRVPVVPNLFDKKRPAFDTPGRALNALRSIWLRDPTGPLADDALMLAASYHVRSGNWIEADRLFEILRTEYPKSPHVETAFVLGSHVKLMSYQGENYDGTSLEESEELKKNTLKLFPNNSERTRLNEELAKMNLLKARREWAKVEFYQSKSKHESVAVYCLLIMQDYPDTEYAQKARDVFTKLPPEVKAQYGLKSPGQPQPVRPPAVTPPKEQEPATPRRFPILPFRRVPAPEPDQPKSPGEKDPTYQLIEELEKPIDQSQPGKVQL